MKRDHFKHFNIAGFTYGEGPIVFNHLKIGTQLNLVREKENKYDDNAIAIYYKSHKIGYVPRIENDVLAKLCEYGYSYIFDVRINRVSPICNPEQQVGVVIYIISKQ